MILDDIIAKKKITLSKNQYKFSLESFLEKTKNIKTQSFKNALAKEGLSIIGEIKKASPSRGLIKSDFDPIALAKEYGGAVDAISVLTEEDFFLGSPKYLEQVHGTVDLPVLRKDFIISPLQILEARELGASAVLLIAAMLDKTTLSEFYKLAKGIGLDVLTEVHNKEELDMVLDIDVDIIGINNRNLYDFTEDIYTTVELRKYIPKEKIVISESSIHTTEDIKILKQGKIHGILVGESFMKCGDIMKKAQEFKNAYGM